MQKIKTRNPTVEEFNSLAVELTISKENFPKPFNDTIHTNYDDSVYIIEDEGGIETFHTNKIINKLHEIKKDKIAYAIIEMLEIEKIHY